MIRYTIDSTLGIVLAYALRQGTGEGVQGWLLNLASHPQLGLCPSVLLDLRLSFPLPEPFAWWFVTGLERGCVPKEGRWALLVHEPDLPAVERLADMVAGVTRIEMRGFGQPREAMAWLRPRGLG
jgi:hypothetical protein